MCLSVCLPEMSTGNALCSGQGRYTCVWLSFYLSELPIGNPNLFICLYESVCLSGLAGDNSGYPSV